MLLPRTALKALLAAKHASPHDFLGMHRHVHRRKKGVIVRAFVREAARCDVIDDDAGGAIAMTPVAPQGVFAGFIPGRPDVFRYQLRATLHNGDVRQFFDPYLRTDASGQAMFAIVCHFTPVIRPNYRVGVPRRGFWKEVLNTNSQYYGGGGLGNYGGCVTEDILADGSAHSIRLTLPPLSTTIYKWAAET